MNVDCVSLFHSTSRHLPRCAHVVCLDNHLLDLLHEIASALIPTVVVGYSQHMYECLYLLHCNCVSITRCASSHLQKCQNSVSRLCRLCTRCKNVVLVQLELWTTRTALYIIITSKREFERISLTHKFWSSWKKPDFAPSHLRVFWCIACGCRICVEWSSCSFGWKTA